MSDSFSCTLDRRQWADISTALCTFSGGPVITALQVQIRNNLRKPRGDFATRFRILGSRCDGELYLVPDGFENEFRKKDLDGEPLHDYYSWIATLEDLTFAHPVERQQ